MEPLGRQLRALRTAEGRTVASVAAEAGLSVPYIANLENARGNPTISALDRLATALGVKLTISLTPADGAVAAAAAGPAQAPASLIRFCRTARFRRATQAMAGGLKTDTGDLSRRLVAALSQLASALEVELAEADWGRLLDALLLIATHPAG